VNEDQITEALFGTLNACEPETIGRFLAEVAGVHLSSAHFTVWSQPREDWHPPDRPGRGVVVGLAATDRVRPGQWKDPGWGESKVDSAIYDDDVLVAFEVKVRRNALDSKQMLRHASGCALRLEIDPGAPDFDRSSLPPGFALATWDHVAGWLDRELALPDRPEALDRLRTTLLDEDVYRVGAHPPTAVAASLVEREPKPPVTPLSEIRSQWRLDEVYKACSRRYGHEPISASACEGEAKRVIAAYRSLGLDVPRGVLFGGSQGGMPPERVLSHLYGHRGGQRLLPNAYPATWTGFRDRTIDSGADRYVLASMLAWAYRTTDRRARERIQRNVPAVWAIAPDRAPGSEELHDALAPARSS